MKHVTSQAEQGRIRGRREIWDRFTTGGVLTSHQMENRTRIVPQD
jgi:hypothetical protein